MRDIPSGQQLARQVELTEKRIDLLMARFAQNIAAAVESLGDRPLTGADYTTIMRAVDVELTRIYGSRRGSASTLADTVVQQAAQARRVVATTAVNQLEPIIEGRDPGLLMAIKAQAGDRS